MSDPDYSALDSTTADVMYRSAESLVSWSDSEKLLEAFASLACRKAYFYGSENSRIPRCSALEMSRRSRLSAAVMS